MAKARKPSRKSPLGLRARLCKALRMRSAIPCVGIVVLAGSLTIIVAPDDEPKREPTPVIKRSFPTVVIDPGHGGNDDGAKSRGNVEKRLTLDVALRLEKLLTQYSFPTVLTRRDDSYVSLEERAAIANKLNHAIFVSIHFNQSYASSSSGIETFYATRKVAPEADWNWVGFFNKPTPPNNEDSETLAGYIQAAMVMRTELPNRGIRGRSLYVVRHTRCPSVLVECGFMSNPIESSLMGNNTYRDLLARALAEGILTYQKSLPQPSGTAPKMVQTRL
jgi:N-acetylmuramoyl-L-alanine amidase